ncbi:MAG: hypothetical protein DHS20C15_19790 [Planctomycetota bacterium]|nr:MAG: hypothetical protein DHS20C15_19790 [Planctomycetota bacterium]
MFEFIHTRIAWIAGCLLIWTSYGALQDDTKVKAIKKLERVEIGAELVERRDPLSAAPKLRDPFNVPDADGAPRDATLAKTGMLGALDTGLHWVASNQEFLSETVAPFVPALNAWRRAEAHVATLGQASLSPVVAGPPPAFRLQLEAVSRADGVSSARINGRLFREGDVIPNSDAYAPPRVAGIEGVSVYVMHRGKVLTLDLDDAPVVQVGEPAVSSGGASSSSSSQASGSTLSPRARNRALRAGGGAP